MPEILLRANQYFEITLMESPRSSRTVSTKRWFDPLNISWMKVLLQNKKNGVLRDPHLTRLVSRDRTSPSSTSSIRIMTITLKTASTLRSRLRSSSIEGTLNISSEGDESHPYDHKWRDRSMWSSGPRLHGEITYWAIKEPWSRSVEGWGVI